MKAFFVLLIAIATFFTGSSFAQSKPSPVFNLKFPTEGDTLITGWSLHKGDDIVWGTKKIDDLEWIPFNPSKDIKDIDLHGINWLRVIVRKDSTLIDTPVALMCRQFVASEIYLDGKKIAAYGTLGPVAKGYTPHNEPLKLTIADAKNHILAIRFAIPDGILKFRYRGYTLPIFEAWASSDETANAEKEADRLENLPRKAMYLIFTGIFFILTIIHFAIYGWYTRHKAHLYYALTTMVGIYECFRNYINLEGIHSPVAYQWGVVFAWTLQLTACTFTFTVYALFGYKNRNAYWLLVGFSLMSILVFWLNGNYGIYLAFFIVPLVNAVETVRIGIWAWKRNLSGALFVVIGITAFLILLSLSYVVQGKYSYMVLGLAQLSFPIGMAIFLAIQTATTNRTLEAKLEEVNALSEKNLEQEKEKQQLLANQNIELEHQVKERTTELTNSLHRLQQTQAQLIQSEKMASLGELTAGIAHEIQNPLNFVNNFSEVSIELLTELKEEAVLGNTTDVIAIAGDLQQNLEKINHHGKRADNIVKGMLQHSRSSEGEWELTDINALANEYLKLSYNGSRAKDKLLDIAFQTDFDQHLPKVNVVAQGIGRVLLNILNNAFYAVNKQKQAAEPGYNPLVFIRTNTAGKFAEIRIGDNGTGIPASIRDKIFQPFFTTKATGEGTGLGLSLSYDIITKVHNGSIALVDTPLGSTEFLIRLPI